MPGKLDVRMTGGFFTRRTPRQAIAAFVHSARDHQSLSPSQHPRPIALILPLSIKTRTLLVVVSSERAEAYTSEYQYLDA
jgi:hypothetical protein